MPVHVNLMQAQRIVSHAKTLGGPARPLRLGIVHTYTSDLLDPWLELESSLAGLEIQTYHGPYGSIIQEADERSGLVAHAPDVTLLLLRAEDLHPALTRPIANLDGAERDILRTEVLQRLRTIVDPFGRRKLGRIVLSMLPPVLGPSLGLFDSHSDRSETFWRAQLNADCAAYLRDCIPGSLFLDLEQVMCEIGRHSFFDERLWYSSRFPFSPEAAREVARRVIAVGTILKFPKAKVLVLDADNTLWGGIVGEDGFNGIALGPDYPGNAFVAFQRRVLDFQQRGFILALCSKNNPEDVKQVLDEHPHQILRDEHFAAQRVNWKPKTENLVSLAEELNLGLDSFIFLDDSAHECAAVRHSLPQVEVIQTPSKPVLIPACLDKVGRLEILSLTKEDLEKTELYAQERRRRAFVQEAGEGSYLASLQMKMRVGLNDESHLTRLVQLTQKTNQFNLTTRRYGEPQMLELMRADDWIVADFSLADIFGDSGIVGLAMIRINDATHAELDTFLMSCRVIGREAEAAFLECLLRELVERGVSDLRAAYIPTSKNALVAQFLPQHEFDAAGGTLYKRDLKARPPKPEETYPIAVTVAAYHNLEVTADSK
jgi:FkbH-like protein